MPSAKGTVAEPPFRSASRVAATRRPGRRSTWMTSARPTVLIIDDEAPLRRFLRAGFELANFTVREADSAAEGLKSATLKMPDLIILDLGLPDRDGAELLDHIRSW